MHPVSQAEDETSQAQKACHSSSAFTLIELLVVIAIIAILAIVVVLVLSPGQLLAQARDSNRLSDLNSLQSALNYYVADASINGAVSMGNPLTVYVSIPDLSATSTLGDQCQGLGLPTLPASYTYHCSASSTARLVDGTGWVPVNMKTISNGPPIGALPIDPANTSSTRNYYTYTTDGRQFEITASVESAKYKLGGPNDVVGNDGGTLATVLERGTKLGLEPLDYGDPSLVGYWTFDEGAGTVAYDYSGSNATGSFSGSAPYFAAGKIGAWASNTANGVTQGATIPGQAMFAMPTFTVIAWENFSAVNVFMADGMSVTACGGSFEGWYWISGNFFYCNGSNVGTNVGYTFPSLNTWHQLAITFVSNGSANIFIDGSPSTSAAVGSITYGAPPTNIRLGSQSNGGNGSTGSIDDVRIYNRALSAAEIQAIYNGVR
jgi:prepilin-type N-terminal cleavage/methylation domain-containing protein